MPDEPTALEAKIYMEICASLMTAMGKTEIEIDLSNVPNMPFQLWRRVQGDKLTVRLIWEEPTAGRA
jgi:hypothetical protein